MGTCPEAETSGRSWAPAHIWGTLACGLSVSCWLCPHHSHSNEVASKSSASDLCPPHTLCGE